MTNPGPSKIVLTAYALLGVAPGALAIYFYPGLWAAVSVACAGIATTALSVTAFRAAEDLAATVRHQRQMQTAAVSSEERIAALEAKLRETASHDEVSGTLNRKTFLTRIDESIRRDGRLKKPMALLLVDIDGFKKLNGDAGRLIGDRVLKMVGKAIQASTRGTDFVGRFGGDEFAVMLGECEDPRPAIDRIFVALHGESTGGERPVPVRVSIGAVTIDVGAETVDPVQLFRIAEDALATVRGGGRCAKRDYRVESRRPASVS
jgi:diguanylate cyclase (GGDEF)-like protein